jgi:hypothetical protein
MNALANKAHDITQATALSAESPRRWANIFAHVYCDLLAKADDAEIQVESELIGIGVKPLLRLAKYTEADDDLCLAEAVRALGSRHPTPAHAELWFARIEQMLGLDDEDKTVLER